MKNQRKPRLFLGGWGFGFIGAYKALKESHTYSYIYIHIYVYVYVYVYGDFRSYTNRVCQVFVWGVDDAV